MQGDSVCICAELGFERIDLVGFQKVGLQDAAIFSSNTRYLILKKDACFGKGGSVWQTCCPNDGIPQPNFFSRRQPSRSGQIEINYAVLVAGSFLVDGTSLRTPTAICLGKARRTRILPFISLMLCNAFMHQRRTKFYLRDSPGSMTTYASTVFVFLVITKRDTVLRAAEATVMA